MNDKQQTIKAALQDELGGMLGVLSDDMTGHIDMIFEGAGIEVDHGDTSLIADRICMAISDWLNGSDSESVTNVWGYVLKGIE